MDKQKTEIIMDTSDKAATYRTNIKGWVSRHGLFFGDGEDGEKAARYHGCTHRACMYCGAPALKMYTACDECRKKRERERYLKKDVVKWDEKTPLYSDAYDKYFFDIDEIYEFVEEEGIVIDDLMLLLCQPVRLRHVGEDYWADDLPEDRELPKSVIEALEQFNASLDRAGIVAWEPSRYRVVLKEGEWV